MTSANARPDATISERIAAWAHGCHWDDIPHDVRRRATLHIVDSVGVALAAGEHDFAKRAARAVTALAGGGEAGSTVIGLPDALPLRDAIHLNGTLIHGLDFDDTFTAGKMHPSASCLPTALALAENGRLSGRELLVGYIIGMEVAGRLSSAALGGGFINSGFHPTGVVGAFASAVTAGRMQTLTAAEIVLAQGFVGSLAAGSMQWVETGAWTKRQHSGWAGVCGVTAAAFAGQGFLSPDDVYEGRFGLYSTHLRPSSPADLASCAADLGEQWVFRKLAAKPMPACHYTHALSDAALQLRAEHRFRDKDVRSITCLVAEEQIPVIFEPAQTRKRPASSYEAQFSGPYVVAASLIRGQFTLEELQDEAWTQADILALSELVTYEVDPQSLFPAYFSGGVRIELTSGEVLEARIPRNRGNPPEELSESELTDKYLSNARLVCNDGAAEKLLDALLHLAEAPTVEDITRLLRTCRPTQGS
jgi:2-methylcitrate dehydratase PrpD